MAGNAKSKANRPDFASFAGLIIAIGGILLGQRLEGGQPGQILRGSAALIVLGGTMGSVLISMPLATLIAAARRVKDVFFERAVDAAGMIEEIIGYAAKARKNGIVSLETETAEIADPFLRKALTLAVDGTDLQEIRKMMELEITVAEQRAESAAKVYEAAGGYSPTIGIIGAVIGLIMVMGNLDNIEKVGEGIASAFVATIYGVGFANILCLPAATKIKARAHGQTELNELILEGVVGIVEGLNPKLIRAKLEAYVTAEPVKGSAPAARASAAAQTDAAPAKG